LAVYIIFPGTFTSLQKSDALKPGDSENVAEYEGKHVLRQVAHLPLLWVAAVCCAAGAAGMGALWWRWRQNAVWVLNRIFLYVRDFLIISLKIGEV
jgi:hypothetical protein